MQYCNVTICLFEALDPTVTPVGSRMAMSTSTFMSAFRAPYSRCALCTYDISVHQLCLDCLVRFVSTCLKCQTCVCG